MRGRKQSTMHRVLDKVLMIVSIIVTVCIIVALALNAPIVSYTSIENGVKTTKDISVISYYKNWKPLVNIEGTLQQKDQSAYDVAVETDSNGVDETVSDDGLDLTQIIEGQYTILFLGFDESGKLSDVDWVF